MTCHKVLQPESIQSHVGLQNPSPWINFSRTLLQLPFHARPWLCGHGCPDHGCVALNALTTAVWPWVHRPQLCGRGCTDHSCAAMDSLSLHCQPNSLKENRKHPNDENSVYKQPTEAIQAQARSCLTLPFSSAPTTVFLQLCGLPQYFSWSSSRSSTNCVCFH